MDPRLAAFRLPAFIAALVVSAPTGALASWPTSPTTNLPVHAAQPVAADGQLRSPDAFTDTGVRLPGCCRSIVAWGDYDNDGDLDVLGVGTTDGSGSRIYRNDGGAFVAIDAGLADDGSDSGAWGDYDNDGALDLALPGHVYHNNRDGTFSDIHVSGWQAMFVGSICWVDFDRDGDLDLFAMGIVPGGMGGEHPDTQLWRNDGHGQFRWISTDLPPAIYCTAEWADYDKDGYPDVLLGSQLFRNLGNRHFTHVVAGFPDPVFEGRGAWGDYDNDGYPDIALPQWGVIHNNADGTFSGTPTGPLPGGGVSGTVAWGDYDNDGRLDLLFMGGYDISSSVNRIYHNDGGGVFTDIGAGLPSDGPSYGAWGDLDKDGDLDLLLTSGSSSSRVCAVYRNDVALSNSPPQAPDGPWSVDVSGGDVTLHWTAATDAETPAAGLTYNVRVGTSPGGSEIMSAMSDPATGYRRIVQVGNAEGGTSLTLHLPETQFLYWSVQAVDAAFAGSAFSHERFFGPVPTLPCLFSIDAEPGSIEIAWYAVQGFGGGATVYRREVGTDWVALGHIAPDGTGFLRYMDTMVLPSTRYGYRLGTSGAEGQISSDEAWAEVPQEPLAFALEKLSPNPARGGALTVRFSLPNGTPARLELLDARGRHVVEQTITGAGRHSINLGQTKRIASGIYFVRLIHGSEARTERAAVLQ